MTTVNATLSVVTSNQYQKDALRTKSDAYFGANIKRSALVQKLTHIVDDNETLDHYKKAMFYGRGLGEHTPIIEPESSVETSDKQLRDIIHAVLGINTEGGELAERLRDMLLHFDGVAIGESSEVLTEQDKINLFEELGDVLWYVAIAAEAMGVTIDAIMTANIEKLKKRFPEKFTQEKAIERNIENEQKSLEKSLTGWTDTAKVEPSKPTTKRVTK